MGLDLRGLQTREHDQRRTCQLRRVEMTEGVRQADVCVQVGDRRFSRGTRVAVGRRNRHGLVGREHHVELRAVDGRVQERRLRTTRAGEHTSYAPGLQRFQNRLPAGTGRGAHRSPHTTMDLDTVPPSYGMRHRPDLAIRPGEA
jgi:hypothetical protein